MCIYSVFYPSVQSSFKSFHRKTYHIQLKFLSILGYHLWCCSHICCYYIRGYYILVLLALVVQKIVRHCYYSALNKNKKIEKKGIEQRVTLFFLKPYQQTKLLLVYIVTVVKFYCHYLYHDKNNKLQLVLIIVVVAVSLV